MGKRGPKPHPDILTPRQWEVLALVREGLRDQEIANRLDISLDGAKYHVSEILSKLGVSTRAEAAAWEPRVVRPLRTRLAAWAAVALALAMLGGLGLLAFGVLLTDEEGEAPVMTFLVTGAGMEPTFSDGDSVEVFRYTSLVERGDIVVFQAPTAPEREFVKRVIGLPGDRIRIDSPSGTIRVNGELLDEPYVRGPTQCIPDPVCLFDVPPASQATAAPNDPRAFDNSGCETSACYFVLGDNRPNSSDSRQGWLVPAGNIIGYVNP